MPEIIKAKLTSRYLDNILAGGLESKRSVDWPRILLAIIVTFESLQHSTKCLFLLIRKAAATIHISSLRSTHKDSILYYKSVKVTINTPSFAKVILDVVVCYHYLLGMVVSDSGAFYPLKTCHCCAIFQRQI